jgi:hypothetical protein
MQTAERIHSENGFSEHAGARLFINSERVNRDRKRAVNQRKVPLASCRTGLFIPNRNDSTALFIAGVTCRLHPIRGMDRDARVIYVRPGSFFVFPDL